MFKRANKITALLIAAASIMSVVPAMASERLGTKDGTINSAITFKDGKYIYQGYKTEDDNKSVYYNSGDKDKELADLTDATLGYRFDTNSAIADDGDEYLVDLSTGKVSDENLASDTKSTASDKLKSKLKKTDRYGDNTINTLTAVTPDQFGEVWYQYKATTTGSVGTDVATATATLYGYTDKTGKYIDASKTANIRVFNGTKMVKIDEFDNDATDGIKADLDPNFVPVTIAQDADNFYSVIKVNFTTEGAVKVYDSKGETVITTQMYVQKISKTQGDKEKDAYLPKTVETYDLTDTMTEGDVDTAYNKIMNYIGIKVNKDEGKTVVGLRVVDGIIYYTEMDDSDTVKTYKFKFNKNMKLDTTQAGKVDAYAVKKDGDKDHDLKGIGAAGASIDINGNLWIVNEGKILKSEKAGDFKEMFTCDRSLDSLDVYDDGSLIAWDSTGDVYTTVQEGSAVTEGEAVPAVPVKTGWDQLADGTWNFLDATGAKVANNWVNVGGTWYYLKAEGVMATGWANVGGTWYYLAGSGAMKTGWLNDNGTWYFLQSSGAMKTGWLNDSGTWYYLYNSGNMASNTTVDGYTINASGAWVK